MLLLGATIIVGLGRTDASGRSPPNTSATAARGATEAVGRVHLVRVGHFRVPVHVTAPPEDPSRVMVVERGGRIRVVRDGEVQRRPFLDIRRRVRASDEQGLLSLAFAPDYADSGLFYLYFTDRAGDQRVVEYRRRNADRAAVGSARLVLRMADDHRDHNGGQLAFGPDAMLYIGTGDGGGIADSHGARGNAQDLGSLLGKILRIDPRARRGRAYSIPAGNPFRRRRGARDEIYAYGLRNPWRFSFDRETGDLGIGDVGQTRWEEINFARRGRGRGANFGWRPFEGRARFAPGEVARGHVEPVIVQSHRRGSCAVVGGFVVRDRAVPLYGRYVFGDLCRRRLFSAKLTAAGARELRRTSLRVSGLTSFGEDALGRVYTASLGGAVHRIGAED
ncbi:MAG: PQQ-dependent sugar dehydrogenase [Actinomycetota bacterium]|nr:PQQ-dependent sugar dehydrogenase [Actinomycetota bacterium]